MLGPGDLKVEKNQPLLVKGDLLYRDGVRDGSPSRGVREDPPEKRRGHWARAGWTAASADWKVRLQ